MILRCKISLRSAHLTSFKLRDDRNPLLWMVRRKRERGSLSRAMAPRVMEPGRDRERGVFLDSSGGLVCYGTPTRSRTRPLSCSRPKPYNNRFSVFYFVHMSSGPRPPPRSLLLEPEMVSCVWIRSMSSIRSKTRTKLCYQNTVYVNITIHYVDPFDFVLS
jgi:hypothetical protein